MSRTVQAVYENGAFRPLEPIACQEQKRVVLTVENATAVEENVLDQEFLAYCETQADDSVSLEAVRQALAKIPGSLADDIRAERDEDGCPTTSLTRAPSSNITILKLARPK